MQEGVSSAYKAVMKPAEGTVLTVSRLAAKRAVESAETETDVEKVLEEAIREGYDTLARTIDMGLVKPTDGKIFWNGEDITTLGITERAKKGISYGFQQPPRFKGLTVRDLLTLSSGNGELSKDRCCQYLTRVGLCANDYLSREVDVSLSGGEVKRIEIATILARNAALMIFDEPEAGIDLWSFTRLTETFEQIHDSGAATMVAVELIVHTGTGVCGLAAGLSGRFAAILAVGVMIQIVLIVIHIDTSYVGPARPVTKVL